MYNHLRAQILCAQNDAIEAFGFVVDGLLRAEKYTMQGSALCCGYFENNDADLSYAFMLYLSKRGMKNQMLLSCWNIKQYGSALLIG